MYWNVIKISHFSYICHKNKRNITKNGRFVPCNHSTSKNPSMITILRKISGQGRKTSLRTYNIYQERKSRKCFHCERSIYMNACFDHRLLNLLKLVHWNTKTFLNLGCMFFVISECCPNKNCFKGFYEQLGLFKHKIIQNKSSVMILWTVNLVIHILSKIDWIINVDIQSILV